MPAWLVIVVIITSLAIFGFVLKRHFENSNLQNKIERLKTINHWELNCLDGDFSVYPQGEQYKDVKHSYSSDLDIFGSHSLFAYLNRTTSPSGSDLLASWLKQAAETTEIKKRQDAVKELSAMIDFRQEMQAIGINNKVNNSDLYSFVSWLNSKAELIDNRKMLYITNILPIATISAILLSFIVIPFGFVVILFAMHIVVYGLIFRKINYLHQKISNKVGFVNIYKELIECVDKTTFSTPYLASIHNTLGSAGALGHIRALNNRIKRLDYRLNQFFIPINILFFFDYKHLFWLERFRQENGQNLLQWFDALAKIEALSSFANASHNNPEWIVPKIVDEYFHVNGNSIGHPLIADKQRVCNDFSINGSGKVSIITGSNMSGKSTFQRSIGVNMVLALAGCSVCAKNFQISNCKLYTYMRIADNLEEQTSSFYAELKRLKQLIDFVKEGQKIFFLLDEVLRGTNSRDRQIGSIALVRQLVKLNVSGIIATHDIALGDLENELPQLVSNSHFDVQITDDSMAFDYKLHEGICKSRNASILMKNIGIDVQDE
jgi:hypothetical protein